MPHCLDPETVEKVTTETFAGSDWEKSMELHGAALSARSKKL